MTDKSIFVYYPSVSKWIDLLSLKVILHLCILHTTLFTVDYSILGLNI